MRNTKTTLPIYDLYDLWYEPFWRKPWFWPITIVFLMFLIILIGVWFFKKRKHQIVKLDSWEQALQKLDLLEIAEFKHPDMHKQFYSKITEILKEYLSSRYDLVLTSKTDKEVIAFICASEFPKSLYQSLKEIFQGALYIKFANKDAVLEKMQNDLNQAKGLVKGTMEQ